MTYLHQLPNGRTVTGINRNETAYLYREIFQDEAYIPPFELRLPSTPVVLDIGANIGLFTLFALERWPGARIHAFEPVPEVFAALHRNTAHLREVTLHNLGVGDTKQARNLTHYPNNTMMSGYDADPVADRALVSAYLGNIAEDIGEGLRAEFLAEARAMAELDLQERRMVPCDLVPLGAFAAEAGLDRVDLMKVDVEGFELRVLQGVGDALWPGIRNAAVEVADRDGRLAAVTGLLDEHGMRTLVRQAHGYQGTDLYMVFAWRED